MIVEDFYDELDAKGVWLSNGGAIALLDANGCIIADAFAGETFLPVAKANREGLTKAGALALRYAKFVNKDGEQIVVATSKSGQPEGGRILE